MKMNNKETSERSKRGLKGPRRTEGKRRQGERRCIITAYERRHYGHEGGGGEEENDVTSRTAAPARPPTRPQRPRTRPHLQQVPGARVAAPRTRGAGSSSTPSCTWALEISILPVTPFFPFYPTRMMPRDFPASMPIWDLHELFIPHA